MVLDCPCLALEAQIIQNLLNKPLTKFGSVDMSLFVLGGSNILKITYIGSDDIALEALHD